MLSAQTTDKGVNKVTKILFQKYPSLESLNEASIDDIKDIIRPIGNYNKKALNVKEIVNSLLKEFNVTNNPQILFNRIKFEDIKPIIEEIQAKQKAENAPKIEFKEVEPITIDDFAKIQLKVGVVLDCEAVPKSKLLHSTVRVGTKTLSILSGIAKYYTPSGANIDKIGIPPDEEVKLPGVSEEEQQIYVDLMNSNKINDFAKSVKNVTEKEIEAFAEELYKDYPLDKCVLRRLVRIYSVTGEIFYDLDYDTQLQRAIEIANSKDFYELLNSTKNLLEIEEEKALEEEKNKDSQELNSKEN
jgi:hypothetical protein